MVVVVLPTPSEGWGRGGTLRRLNSRATTQGLDQRFKMEEVVPKMARRRGLGAGLSGAPSWDYFRLLCEKRYLARCNDGQRQPGMR